MSHPWVSDVVMFGRARPQAGMLIDPAPSQAVDPSDEAAVAEYIDAVWSVPQRFQPRTESSPYTYTGL